MKIPSNSEFMINVAKTDKSLNVLKNNPESSQEIQKAAQDFEAVLLNMVLKAMWKTIPESDLFEKNNASKIYEGFMHTSLSEEMAGNGGLGIAKVLAQQLSREHKNHNVIK
ncbi:rod binding protein [Candidatus Scalindua japonica]|uniref:Rod binding protein n=1 Tax=Candidatus Scalindua japonica TaxID=1284222 RepID=A0A286TVE5_9BACT|nr:rod-binding protein [Candidatus Scalindua japonica]GAX59811.1 rod binding protein [Candidatus Scalindua japonica]